jgi:hypothetical protein
MVGPDGVVDKNKVVGSETMPIGMTTDNVITIGEILGFKNDIEIAGYVDSDSRSLFDRM